MSKKKYTKKEKKILTLISNFCCNECGSCTECPEDNCILYNIEQVITSEPSKRSESNIKEDK